MFSPGFMVLGYSGCIRSDGSVSERLCERAGGSVLEKDVVSRQRQVVAKNTILLRQTEAQVPLHLTLISLVFLICEMRLLIAVNRVMRIT